VLRVYVLFWEETSTLLMVSVQVKMVVQYNSDPNKIKLNLYLLKLTET